MCPGATPIPPTPQRQRQDAKAFPPAAPRRRRIEAGGRSNPHDAIPCRKPVPASGAWESTDAPDPIFVSQRDLDRWLFACYVVRTMPTGNGGIPSQGEASAPNIPPQASLLTLAAAVGTSQLTAITTFLAAIGAASVGFRKLQTALGLSVPQCAALVGALLLLLFFSHTLPTVLEAQEEPTRIDHRCHAARLFSTLCARRRGIVPASGWET